MSVPKAPASDAAPPHGGGDGLPVLPFGAGLAGDARLAGAGLGGHPLVQADDRLLATLADAGLLQAIEGEVIPRLLLAHRQMTIDAQFNLEVMGLDIAASRRARAGRGGDGLSDGTVAEFARLLVTHDAPVAIGFVDMHIAQGCPVPDLLLDLCAPAARELGAMWLRDECSFCEVTIGLSSLERVIVHCTGGDQPVLRGEGPHRSVLLGLVPGNQHLFGLLIVRELFVRAGWSVVMPGGNTAGALLAAVRSTRFTAVGLSVGGTDALPACRKLVHGLRSESLNPDMMVIVGGQGIQEATVQTRRLGADLIARDGREGLDQIERMAARLGARGQVN